MMILLVSAVILLLCQLVKKPYLQKLTEVKNLLKQQYEAGVKKAKIVIAFGAVLTVFQLASIFGIVLEISRLF